LEALGTIQPKKAKLRERVGKVGRVRPYDREDWLAFFRRATSEDGLREAHLKVKVPFLEASEDRRKEIEAEFLTTDGQALMNVQKTVKLSKVGPYDREDWLGFFRRATSEDGLREIHQRMKVPYLSAVEDRWREIEEERLKAVAQALMNDPKSAKAEDVLASIRTIQRFRAGKDNVQDVLGAMKKAKGEADEVNNGSLIQVRQRARVNDFLHSFW
jgi:hypothetical protein